MKQRMSLNDALAALVLTVYFAELVCPMLTVLLPSTAVCFGCFLLWLFLVTTINKKFLLWKHNFVLLTIFVYMVLYPLLFGYKVIANRYAAMNLVLCGTIVFRYYYAFNKLYILKRVLAVTLALSLITMIITFRELLVNSYISRSIKSSGDHSMVLAKRGIGGYSFIYYIAALSIPTLYYAMKTRKKKYRIFALSLYLFSLLFIIKSNYMTALLTTVLCSAVLVALSSFSNRKWGGVLGILSGVVLFIFIIFLKDVLDALSSFLPERIARVLVSGSGKSAFYSIMQEFLIDRWPTIQLSVDAFFKHPLLGLVGSGELGYSGEYLVGFGQHSFIFDTLGLFGMFGGVICTYASFSPLKKNTVWKNHSALRISMLLCAGILYFLNNATASIALAISIIAPYCAYSIDNSIL